VIKDSAHKGLEAFFLWESKRGIQPVHARRLGMLLERLDNAGQPEDLRFAGSGLHALKGTVTGLWSVRVSANWRVVFRFDDGDAYDVDYLDYH
jgi:proteic killer suppression protein